ncbi:hypothetical protein GWI33_015847 [Rhynchophorus ferrugineus]|uniref:Uncharacterized protein n=1 Tax=Rhynchophorus ferrugineus TaxID=354439 RepID=A0A834HZ69_RHYFE|nr:hypothetical protein GWI33_015847 [Rhynchophorus ferrugineus]
MDKIEFRILIKYCFLKGKNTVEAKTWLDVDFDWQGYAYVRAGAGYLDERLLKADKPKKTGFMSVQGHIS